MGLVLWLFFFIGFGMIDSSWCLQYWLASGGLSSGGLASGGLASGGLASGGLASGGFAGCWFSIRAVYQCSIPRRSRVGNRKRIILRWTIVNDEIIILSDDHICCIGTVRNIA
jgi:hypothetical protein